VQCRDRPGDVGGAPETSAVCAALAQRGGKDCKEKGREIVTTLVRSKKRAGRFARLIFEPLSVSETGRDASRHEAAIWPSYMRKKNNHEGELPTALARNTKRGGAASQFQYSQDVSGWRSCPEGVEGRSVFSSVLRRIKKGVWKGGESHSTTERSASNHNNLSK